MDIEQLGIQLGIAGALIFAFVKVSLVLIEKWSKGDEARTKALADGFAALVGKIDAHHTLDMQSHSEMVADLAALNSKVDVLADVTPIRQKIPRAPTQPQTGYYGPRKPPREDG